MTGISPSSAAPHDTQAAPLTCATKAGKPYRRFKDIERAISRVLEKPPPEWPDLARVKGSGRLPSEALVYLITISQRFNSDVFGHLVHELGLRIARIAGFYVQGFDSETKNEIVWGVEKEVLELTLRNPSCRQGEFLQIAFHKKIEQRTLNAIAKRKQAPVSLKYSRQSISDDDDECANPVDAIADESPSPEEITAMLQDELRRPALLAAAKAAVKDPRHLEAVILRCAYDWPIEDNDPTVPTLARRYDKSPRQIRNWIGDALEAMRAAIGDLK